MVSREFIHGDATELILSERLPLPGPPHLLERHSSEHNTNLPLLSLQARGEAGKIESGSMTCSELVSTVETELGRGTGRGRACVAIFKWPH